MKIKLNLNIFLFLILFFLTNQIEIYTLVMIFALLHELGHLICGVFLGFKADALRILPIGFAIEFKANVQDYNKKILKSNILSLKKILIAIAGPFINLIIMLAAIILKLDNNIIFSNLLIILFNLIPIYPLDGGRILKSLLKILVGKRKSSMYTNIISNVTVIILTMFSSIYILIYKNIAIPIIVCVLWVMVVKENKKYNTYNKIYKVIDKNYNYL